jgi:hypothetical protein
MKSKAKKIGSINGKTLIVAVDIGKTVHYGYLRGPNGEDVKPFRFYNFRSGFRLFQLSLDATFHPISGTEL